MHGKLIGMERQKRRTLVMWQRFSFISFCVLASNFCSCWLPAVCIYITPLISDLQERKRKEAEEYNNNLQQQAHAKAQGLRYEDELARKRIQVLKRLLFFYIFHSVLKCVSICWCCYESYTQFKQALILTDGA